MEIHHTKHHQTYINKLNEALEKHPDIAEIPLEELLKNPNQIPQDIRSAVINHGGGTYNHLLFWNSMNPNGPHKPTGVLMDAILKTFGSYDAWWKEFSDAAVGQFGSGWVWLTATTDNQQQNNTQLKITKTSNQDSPLTQGEMPLLGLDVWEHAYYLKYQNKRADYIASWKSVLGWKTAQAIYETLIKS